MLYIYQGCQKVRNVRNCQEFEKFCQKVIEFLEMSGEVQEFSIFYDVLSGYIPYFMFFCSV